MLWGIILKLKYYMKKLFFPALLLALSCCAANAQQFPSPVKGSLIGFSVNLTDFNTPAAIKASSLHDVLKNKNFSPFSSLDMGFSLMYWKGLTKHVDFSARYNGLFSSYSKTSSGSDRYINELETSLHAKALSDDHTLNPFLSAGLGGGLYSGKLAPYAPLGAGLQLNLEGVTYVFVQANYRLSLDKARLDNNLFYSLGVTENIGAAKAPKLPPPPPPIPVVAVQDRDNDGVVDSLDACPDAAGLVSLHGCPDTDGDGIADKDDKCATVAGIARYNGCPVPDTDNDGINDEEDKCPAVAGLAKYNGCPVPDTDNDGINDEEDKCPAVAGVKENSGCPLVKEDVARKVAASAKAIFFANGSARLLPKSFISLNKVAAILNEDKELKLDISGHTDNTGKPAKNQLLSEQRAKAVQEYLTGKAGIAESRLSAAGFGDTQPVASNKTAKGKALNRRVVLTPKYY